VFTSLHEQADLFEVMSLMIQTPSTVLKLFVSVATMYLLVLECNTIVCLGPTACSTRFESIQCVSAHTRSPATGNGISTAPVHLPCDPPFCNASACDDGILHLCSLIIYPTIYNKGYR
jgi:hypothetical protein